MHKFIATICFNKHIRYLYDAAGNLLAETDAANNITRYYIHGAGLLAMVSPAGQVYCYHYNATGGTVALTDADQEMVNKYAYDPFGNLSGQCVEAVLQPFKACPERSRTGTWVSSG